ncbi:MAG TPA: ABC transporter permease [Opitutaceae bacterium]|nr:ABC transporter permease [Opitutaceae bacterium]
MIQNLRIAFRQLAKNRGFSVAALLTLALGIGANVAIFSAINALFLRPLSFAEPDRLVRVWGAFADRGLDQANLSYPRYEYLRDQLDVFSDISAMAFTQFNVTGAGEPEQVQAARVSDRFFPLLGVQPLHGRGFTRDDDRAGAAPVALLSHGYWQRRFGGDPSVIGRGLTLNGSPYTIIGVLPASLGFPFADLPVWTTRPFELEGLPHDLMQRGSGYLLVHARLKPGVELGRVNEQLKVVSARYSAAHPDKVDANAGIFARFMQADIVGDQRPTFLVLLSAVGAVLLIACANVANLFLVRLAARRKEIAVRTALGASRGRLVLQFLTESVMLALGAGLVGSALAFWGVSGLAAVAQDFVPRADEIAVDLPVLGFGVLLSLLTGLALGIVPAWQASHADVNEALKDAARGSTGGRGASRVRATLFVAEVALSLLLLICAGLLLRSFTRLSRVQAGFEPANVTTFNISLSPQQYPDAARQFAFYEQLTERLRALPGVDAVSAVNTLPLANGGGIRSPFAVEGEALPPMNERRLAFRMNTLPGYFAALGIPVTQGRDFDWRDRAGRPNVLLVSESTARRLFPNGENPIGRRLITGIASVPREIVGVVGDVRTVNLAEAPGDTLYYPEAQLGDGFLSFVIRSSRPAASLRDEIRAAVHALDPGIPLGDVQPLSGEVAESLALRRLLMGAVGAFALLALGLAGLGIYSVIAYSVAQRTAEIGVRMALGASPVAIVGLVVREGLRLTLFGLALGVGAAVLVTRLLQAQLYEVSTLDPMIYAGVAAFLVLVAAFACWLPARRAARIDPLAALRAD